jgi:hypothetical protein
MRKLRYLGTTATSQSKSMKAIIYRIIILPVVLCEFETWLSFQAKNLD